MNGRHSEKANISISVISENEWNEKISAIEKTGNCKADEIRQQGHHFHVDILGLREVKVKDEVQMAGVKIDLDWKVEQRMELVKIANDMIKKAYMIGCLDPALPVALKSIIEGGGLYEFNIGEFFELYGKFERKYENDNVRDKMLELIKGDDKYLKLYKYHGKLSNEPLPLAVRNIICHGKNTNQFDDSELRDAILLLRSWRS